MHVTIERKYEKVGWFLGVHYFIIELSIAFTEAEIAAIKAARLGSYTILDRPEFAPPYGGNSVTWDLYRNYVVHRLLKLHNSGKPERIYFGFTKPDADAAEAQLRENLKKLKSQIEDVLRDKPSKDSFEL